MEGKNFSHLWKHICRFWSTMLKGAKQATVNGTLVRFWKDVQVGDTPLLAHDNDNIPDHDIQSTLNNYVDDAGLWKSDEFQPYLPNNVLLLIAEIKPPDFNAPVDLIYWSLSSSGNFSMKSAHELLAMDKWEAKDDKWNLIWRLTVQHRVKSFYG